jgi:hypothetical protein
MQRSNDAQAQAAFTAGGPCWLAAIKYALNNCCQARNALQVHFLLKKTALLPAAVSTKPLLQSAFSIQRAAYAPLLLLVITQACPALLPGSSQG